MQDKNKIALIGMPLAGKSAVGRALAEKTGIRYMDLDEEIEKKHGSVASVFAEVGEEGFRKREEEALRDIFQTFAAEPLILSTGGGTPLRAGSVSLLQRHCVVVWLRVSLMALCRRAESDRAQRPLLAGEKTQKLQALYEQRQELYAFADITVDAEGKSTEEIAQEIKKAAGIN